MSIPATKAFPRALREAGKHGATMKQSLICLEDALGSRFPSFKGPPTRAGSESSKVPAWENTNKTASCFSLHLGATLRYLPCAVCTAPWLVLDQCDHQWSHSWAAMHILYDQRTDHGASCLCWISPSISIYSISWCVFLWQLHCFQCLDSRYPMIMMTAVKVQQVGPQRCWTINPPSCKLQNLASPFSDTLRLPRTYHKTHLA